MPKIVITTIPRSVQIKNVNKTDVTFLRGLLYSIENKNLLNGLRTLGQYLIDYHIDINKTSDLGVRIY